MGYLPPHRQPSLLRFLVWTLLVLGILGLVSRLGLWALNKDELNKAWQAAKKCEASQLLMVKIKSVSAAAPGCRR